MGIDNGVNWQNNPILGPKITAAILDPEEGGGVFRVGHGTSPTSSHPGVPSQAWLAGGRCFPSDLDSPRLEQI